MSDTAETKLKKYIVKICKRLHKRNMLAAADGNVSYRMSDDQILITPSGQAKAFMKWEDMATVNITGDVLQGQPSGELSMHLEVYRSCPQAKAVVHAHPPAAIAWTLARPDLQELPASVLPEVILALGTVPIVPYARPTTVQMAEVLKSYLPQRKVMILARHGALSWGEDLDEAYRGMERVEHSAEILRLAVTMGDLTNLPEDEISQLKAMRETLNNKTL